MKNKKNTNEIARRKAATAIQKILAGARELLEAEKLVIVIDESDIDRGSERERQDRQDRLTYEQSEQIRQWAKELLALDKSLNKWEIGFLVKITKTRLTLTERQGDKVHDMYLNYTGGGG